MKHARTLAALALAALLTAACAPTATTTTVRPADPGPRAVGSSPIVNAASFFPVETGLAWEYLIEGDALSGEPILTRSIGPTTLDGQPTHRLRTTGRGIDITRYYRHDASGLLLVREDRPGVVLQYQPPMLVLPTEAHLTVGARWGGSTLAHVTFLEAPPERQHQTITLEYLHHATDYRAVNTPAGTYDAFVITTEATDPASGNPARYERWFTPYVGELRTADALLLTRAVLQ